MDEDLFTRTGQCICVANDDFEIKHYQIKVNLLKAYFIEKFSV